MSKIQSRPRGDPNSWGAYRGVLVAVCCGCHVDNPGNCPLAVVWGLSMWEHHGPCLFKMAVNARLRRQTPQVAQTSRSSEAIASCRQAWNIELSTNSERRPRRGRSTTMQPGGDSPSRSPSFDRLTRRDETPGLWRCRGEPSDCIRGPRLAWSSLHCAAVIRKLGALR